MMKEVDGFVGYYVDKLGNGYSARKNSGEDNLRAIPRKLKPQISPQGYRKINLYRRGKMYARTISSLTLTAFVGKRPVGMQVCHGKNGKLDDSLKNLSWGTIRKNCVQDKLRDGVYPVGEKNGRAKLNELQVRIIRRSMQLFGKEYLSGGGRYRVGCKKLIDTAYLSRIFGVAKQTISAVNSRQNWIGIRQDVSV